MMIEERTRFEVLLENIQTSVNVIAEGHGALAEGQRILTEGQRILTEGQRALVERFDRMEIRFDRLEAKVDGLEVFASDATQRLDRIETRLELNGSKHSSAGSRMRSDAPSKRRKKS